MESREPDKGQQRDAMEQKYGKLWHCVVSAVGERHTWVLLGAVRVLHQRCFLGMQSEAVFLPVTQQVNRQFSCSFSWLLICSCLCTKGRDVSVGRTVKQKRDRERIIKNMAFNNNFPFHWSGVQ